MILLIVENIHTTKLIYCLSVALPVSPNGEHCTFISNPDTKLLEVYIFSHKLNDYEKCNLEGKQYFAKHKMHH